ncbi:MAG: hypothetical protein P1V18_06450 [Candidatus Gracilibacteria bacterium]|nr:hypothetical protein [Candidatus Gracilibacteria bacterium]
MGKNNITSILKKFKKSSQKRKQLFLDGFELKMIYRTSKTENPETTHKMVKKVLKNM